MLNIPSLKRNRSCSYNTIQHTLPKQKTIPFPGFPILVLVVTINQVTQVVSILRYPADTSVIRYLHVFLSGSHWKDLIPLRFDHCVPVTLAFYLSLKHSKHISAVRPLPKMLLSDALPGWLLRILPSQFSVSSSEASLNRHREVVGHPVPSSSELHLTRHCLCPLHAIYLFICIY